MAKCTAQVKEQRNFVFLHHGILPECMCVLCVVYPIQFTQFCGAIERKPEEVSWGILASSFCFDIRGDFSSPLKASG